MMLLYLHLLPKHNKVVLVPKPQQTANHFTANVTTKVSTPVAAPLHHLYKTFRSHRQSTHPAP